MLYSTLICLYCQKINTTCSNLILDMRLEEENRCSMYQQIACPPKHVMSLAKSLPQITVSWSIDFQIVCLVKMVSKMFTSCFAISSTCTCIYWKIQTVHYNLRSAYAPDF